MILGILATLVPQGAHALVGLNAAYIRLDRMAISTVTSGLICAMPQSTATEGKVVVTFPSTYTVNTTAAHWATGTTDIPSGSTAWPSIQATATSAASPSNVVTWTSGDLLSTSTLYCFTFAGTVASPTLTTASSAASSQQAIVQTQTSGGTVIDTTSVALANIANDQITVSATVPPSFIFTLGGNTDSFTTNLNPAAIVSTTGVTATITTNAKGGWITWAKDSEQGLRSPTAAYTIPTAGTVNGAPSTLSAGTEGYVLDSDVTTDAGGGCTVAADAEYNGAGTTQGGTFSANYQPIAACTGGTANGDVITLVERAAISGVTPAATDYADIITVVGAGNF